MGKRSDGFERQPRDLYRTPRAAVLPLLRHLERGTHFAEPCAGDGQLADILVSYGHVCIFASDIEPQRGDIKRGDACFLQLHKPGTLVWITNPPWTRSIMLAIIRHLCAQAPGWFLFDADFVHNAQARPILPILRKIVSVGRVEWIEGSGMTGKDNAAWHYIDGTRPPTPIEFIGRQ